MYHKSILNVQFCFNTPQLYSYESWQKKNRSCLFYFRSLDAHDCKWTFELVLKIYVVFQSILLNCFVSFIYFNFIEIFCLFFLLWLLLGLPDWKGVQSCFDTRNKFNDGYLRLEFKFSEHHLDDKIHPKKSHIWHMATLIIRSSSSSWHLIAY